MARHRTARKSGKQIASTSIQAPKFPANHLPAELIHMIFQHLQPTEAAAFRWAGRRVAAVGLEYLFRTLYLKLNEESYNRFFAIAEHPIFSEHVKSLEYETGGLGPVNRGDFTQMIATPNTVIPQQDDFSERPGSTPSPCANSIETVRDIPFRSKKQGKELSNRAWSIFETFQARQAKVEQAGFFREKMVEAMKRFGNLETISARACTIHDRYDAQIKDLQPNCSMRDVTWGLSSTVDATTSIILAADSARLPVHNFCCQDFKWQQIYGLDEEILAALKKSIFRLKAISLDFAPPVGDIEAGLIYRVYLENGIPMEFITSAPKLEFLELSFRRLLPVNLVPKLKNLVGNFRWRGLKAVSLNQVSACEDDLVRFCKRHANTLKTLSLSNIWLYQGSWGSAFHRIRQAFRLGQQLDTCKLDGFGTLSMAIWEDGKNVSGTIVSDYIRSTDIGDITLEEYFQVIDLNSRFQTFMPRSY